MTSPAVSGQQIQLSTAPKRDSCLDQDANKFCSGGDFMFLEDSLLHGTHGRAIECASTLCCYATRKLQLLQVSPLQSSFCSSRQFELTIEAFPSTSQTQKQGVCIGISIQLIRRKSKETQNDVHITTQM